MHLKYRLQNGGYFVLASMCLLNVALCYSIAKPLHKPTVIIRNQMNVDNVRLL